MIAYYGRFGKYLGQAGAVPLNAPLVSVAPPIAPVVVASPPVMVTEPSAVAREMEQLDSKVSLSKGALLVGGIVLAALTLTLSSSLLRRR